MYVTPLRASILFFSFLQQRLGDCIGKGAAGKVYKGFNVQTGDMCAIKQIKTTFLSPKQLAKATVWATLLPLSHLILIVSQAEGDLLLHLDHPNIRTTTPTSSFTCYCIFIYSFLVRIFDRYTTGKHMYLVLEYMESGSLGNMVRVSQITSHNLLSFLWSCAEIRCIQWGFGTRIHCTDSGRTSIPTQSRGHTPGHQGRKCTRNQRWGGEIGWFWRSISLFHLLVSFCIFILVDFHEVTQ